MKILFLTDNFVPEYNAPATRTYEHCREWVRAGAEVTVLTCAPNFPEGRVFQGYKNKIYQSEIIDGIRVVRVWSFITANAGFFRRTLDFLSFAFSAFVFGLFIRCDIVIATSPQFFTAVSGCFLGFFRRKKWIMEVRDIWPESIKAVEAVRSNRIIAILERVELFLYRNAYKIIVVTDSFKTNLTERGVDPNKIYVVKNGVNLDSFKPRQKETTLLENIHVKDKFVVGYVGTHGLAHSLDFIIRSIRNVDCNSFHFIFIGEGAEKKNVMKLAADMGLRNVTFLDPVKKSEISRYLSLLDVSLVPLRKSTTFESVIPSKVFEAVAMHIPILLGVDGETKAIIEHYNAGLFFEPENEKDFVEKLKTIQHKILTDKDHFTQGCRQMARDFDRRALALKMLNVITTN